jgi:hypothetical protein
MLLLLQSGTQHVVPPFFFSTQFSLQSPSFCEKQTPKTQRKSGQSQQILRSDSERQVI